MLETDFCYLPLSEHSWIKSCWKSFWDLDDLPLWHLDTSNETFLLSVGETMEAVGMVAVFWEGVDDLLLFLGPLRAWLRYKSFLDSLTSKIHSLSLFKNYEMMKLKKEMSCRDKACPQPWLPSTRYTICITRALPGLPHNLFKSLHQYRPYSSVPSLHYNHTYTSRTFTQSFQ